MSPSRGIGRLQPPDGTVPPSQTCALWWAGSGWGGPESTLVQQRCPLASHTPGGYGGSWFLFCVFPIREMAVMGKPTGAGAEAASQSLERRVEAVGGPRGSIRGRSTSPFGLFWKQPV